MDKNTKLIGPVAVQSVPGARLRDRTTCLNLPVQRRPRGSSYGGKGDGEMAFRVCSQDLGHASSTIARLRFLSWRVVFYPVLSCPVLSPRAVSCRWTRMHDRANVCVRRRDVILRTREQPSSLLPSTLPFVSSVSLSPARASPSSGGSLGVSVTTYSIINRIEII